jgi:uncharacterized membrane protein
LALQSDVIKDLSLSWLCKLSGSTLFVGVGKSKANQKYENLKACTKINQKSNDKPKTKTAEESLIHLNTDGAVVAEKRHKTTPTNKVEPDNLHNQDKLKSFITSDCNANAKHIYERLKIQSL